MSDAPRPVRAADLEAATRALVCARHTNLGLEVQLPIIYPTGHAVTVVVNPEADRYIVHDAGFGCMHMAAAGLRLSERLQRRFADLARNYGCEFSEGRMVRRCSYEQLAPALALVGNASRLIGDHVASVKRQSMIDFKREVSGLAAEALGDPERVKNDQEVVGDSGTPYRLNIVILDENKAGPLAYVETVAEQNAVNGRFRAFYDIALNDNLRNIPRLSVYDDRHHWRSGDLIILQHVSNLVPFSAARARIDRLVR